MGNWTTVEGTHNSKKASIKKIVDDVLGGDDLIWDELNGDYFLFRFESVGIEACKNVQKIVDRFKEFDKGCKIEVNIYTLLY